MYMQRNLFLYWEGPDYSLISLFRKLIYLHSKNGKGYKVHLINHKNVHEYIKDLPKCFFKLQLAHQADVVRVNVICDYGGIWIDSDTIVVDKLDGLFDYLETKGRGWGLVGIVAYALRCSLKQQRVIPEGCQLLVPLVFIVSI